MRFKKIMGIIWDVIVRVFKVIIPCAIIVGLSIILGILLPQIPFWCIIILFAFMCLAFVITHEVLDEIDMVNEMETLNRTRAISLRIADFEIDVMNDKYKNNIDEYDLTIEEIMEDIDSITNRTVRELLSNKLERAAIVIDDADLEDEDNLSA